MTYETDISCGPLDWQDHANSQGLSMWRLMRIFRMSSDRIHEVSMRAAPMLTKVSNAKA